MFLEALAALSNDPSSLLVLPPPTKQQGGTTASTTTNLLETAQVCFSDAVRAMAVHLYAHASASLARCMRAAVIHLQQQQWLRLKLRSKPVAAGSSGSNGPKGGSSSDGVQLVQVVDMDTSRDTLRQVREDMALS